MEDSNLKGTVRIPTHIQRTAISLIDQQMWCWGCDVRRTQGDLLLAYGAQKQFSPDTRYHSAYVFTADNHPLVKLWSWGIWLSEPQLGSLFISRSRCTVLYSPQYIPMPDAWRARDLPTMTGVHDQTQAEYAYTLLATALKWIGDYEEWLCHQVESDYREQALKVWPQRKRYKGGTPPEDMPALWFELSSKITKECLLS